MLQKDKPKLDVSKSDVLQVSIGSVNFLLIGLKHTTWAKVKNETKELNLFHKKQMFSHSIIILFFSFFFALQIITAAAKIRKKLVREEVIHCEMIIAIWKNFKSYF